MAKFMGINFAPLFIPLERRLQTLMVLYFTSTFTILPFLCVLLLIALLYTPLFCVVPAYLAWIVYDVTVLKTSSRGGRRVEWLRHHKMWHYFRDYFPCKLIKTYDLDPDRNYIMGYHPHGIIGCGAIANFASEATGFSEKFKRIKPHLLTLKANFQFPILRGNTLYMGKHGHINGTHILTYNVLLHLN